MNREDLIRREFNSEMLLLEIGPSYHPVVPKSEGWRTSIIDHASQAELVAKYAAMGVQTVSSIEPVDFVWRDEALTAIVPTSLHGKYDGLVASHVAEHLPNLIGFLQQAGTLLKSSGVIALALPDKRLCFDFFQPVTMVGDLIAAHDEGRIRHQCRAFLNQAAYGVLREGQIGWTHESAIPFQLSNPLSAIESALHQTDNLGQEPYRDCHAWAFTPKSFRLLILELNLLGYIDWAIRAIEPAKGVEFYVWLERKRLVMPETEANAARLSLLLDMVTETESAIGQVKALQQPKATAPGLASLQRPTIVVIIPLYNGARYIEQALNSVIAQSLPPNEILVVDDGSTDGGAGAAIVEEMGKRHPIKLLRKPNGGQSSARNLGVRNSTSELIAFLDQDDLWYSDHLQQLVKPFLPQADPPLGWSYSDLDEIDERGNLICRNYLSTLGTAHPKRNIFDCVGQNMFILPSAALISRNAFEAAEGFDDRLCGYEDDDLFLRMFRLGYGNVFMKRALSKWRIYPSSTSYSYRMAISRNIYTRKLLEMFPNDPERARFYTRDLIVPRFYGDAMREYDAATKSADQSAIDAAWEEVMLLTSRNAGIVPQTYERMLRYYRAALQSGNERAVTNAWRAVYDLAALHPHAGRKLRTTLRLLRDARVATSLFRVRHAARPAMIWAFRAHH